MSEVMTQEQLSVPYNPNLLVTYKYVPEPYVNLPFTWPLISIEPAADDIVDLSIPTPQFRPSSSEELYDRPAK